MDDIPRRRYGRVPREWRVYNRALPTAFLLGVLAFLVYFVTFAPPLSFPTAAFIHVAQGETVGDVAAELQKDHLIRSAFLFKAVTRLYGSKTRVIEGEYFFPGPQTVLTVARRLARGDYELVPTRVTIPEGANAGQIAALLAAKIPDFDASSFLEIAQPKEGYLFPDTYFFYPGEDPDTVLYALEANFQKHIEAPDVQADLKNFNKPLSDVVTMASLLEKEAPDTHDRRIIAGILWKRISLGMPLQVDAVFPYIIGKSSLELTKADLATSSPYNTYINKGLPPGPIANPSLDSIVDAMTPIKTDYLYYLSDLDGNMHYSATYGQQLAKQRKYLKN